MNINKMLMEVRDEHSAIVDRIDQLNNEISKLQSRRIYLEGRFNALNDVLKFLEENSEDKNEGTENNKDEESDVNQEARD